MSIATLIPAADDFREWETEFGAVYDRDDLPEPDRSMPRHEHRPARCNDVRAAIQRSLREA